jgi:hypothetical protein
MWWINDMDKIEKFNGKALGEDDIGFMLWKLESVENFFPCYKTLIKKEE